MQHKRMEITMLFDQLLDACIVYDYTTQPIYISCLKHMEQNISVLSQQEKLGQLQYIIHGDQSGP